MTIGKPMAEHSLRSSFMRSAPRGLPRLAFGHLFPPGALLQLLSPDHSSYGGPLTKRTINCHS
ncbi:hypothetical protein FHX08_003603 [Rhizobium sp. BK529]|nr:hypothetical protein [Rhizobium sp. BK529]TCS03000.1 hypothetical protein EV281_10480 [Rhizobium sp. BK418]